MQWEACMMRIANPQPKINRRPLLCIESEIVCCRPRACRNCGIGAARELGSALDYANHLRIILDARLSARNDKARIGSVRSRYPIDDIVQALVRVETDSLGAGPNRPLQARRIS